MTSVGPPAGAGQDGGEDTESPGEVVHSVFESWRFAITAGQGHVLLGCQRGEQVEELEDEPAVAAAELAEPLSFR